ncbi:MAG: alpha-keto acid decarboxylase family protein [candidate division WOR-3 bacterium]|nr:MAG: alpha-keto acid decarboxylase family protein [candidate division WOR-3 bacterium]
MASSVGIADYMIERLIASGVRHVFGVPGDYVLGLYKKLSDSPLEVINTCDEQGAGFAADAYARLNGLGVVCVTYGVGGLKVANTTAEAFAERVPVLVISGAPGIAERTRNPMLHHKVKQFDTQRKVFEQLTVASADMCDPATALGGFDRVLDAVLRYKRPGYVELPRDMVAAKAPLALGMPAGAGDREPGDPAALAEALHESAERIRAAHRPVILVGGEVQRFGLEQQVLQLARKINVPIAVSLLAKSTIPETDPLYMGVYAGALGDEAVRSYVEESDCLLLLGVLLTDVNLGIYTAHLDPGRSIHVTSERTAIAHHYYEGVTATDFLQGLIDREMGQCRLAWTKPEHLLTNAPAAPEAAPITVQRLFERINAFLECDIAVVADVGDALFGSLDLVTCRAGNYLSPAYYTSLGFAVPAAIAVQLSHPELRPLVLVGDGAFQMTGMELSTAARYGLNPIVVVLNNGGYATERPMIDGPFNDLLPWHYSRLPELLGHGAGFVVETEEQLLAALSEARANTASYSILDVRLAPDDVSPPLRRLTDALGKRT